jgi:peroxiredoxin
MRRAHAVVAIAGCLVLGLHVESACRRLSAAEEARAPKRAENFELRDAKGVAYSLEQFKSSKAVVLVFLGTECPLATLYAPRLDQLSKRFADRGVTFLGVNSNQQDSISELVAYVKIHGVSFPLLKDVGNVVADQLGAQRTPEVFVLDADRVVRYHGRIDDQYTVGRQRTKPTSEDLATALDELLAGNTITTPETAAPGCRIGRVHQAKNGAKITYAKDIAPLLNQRCVECHRPGEIGPFALTNYAEVVGWADTILEVVDDNRMPPWHANPDYGHFNNDRRLSDADKQLLHDWVAAGAPEGDAKDLPTPPKFAEGWRIPRVDQEVFMSDVAFEVPAEGTVEYKYFTVDPGFTKDMWVQAAQCRPGNRAVVHHIIVGIKPPARNSKRRSGATSSAWLAATAPGAHPLMLPDGMAKLVPAGSKLMFQMHYTPNGSKQKDRSSVALMFTPASKVRKEVGTLNLENHLLLIPPRVSDYKAEAWHTFKRDTLVLSLFPHMHVRGKAFRYEVQYPGGDTEVLLDVPHYDFAWQTTYELAKPKLLPKGTKVHCVAHYDNSADNIANPNPNRVVTWGDQTWDEMMIGYMDTMAADGGKDDSPKKPRTDKFVSELSQRDGRSTKVCEQLRKVASEATGSNESFARFGTAVMRAVPQIDRVCLTVVDGDQVEVRRCHNCTALKHLDLLRGKRVEAGQLAITDYALEKQQVVHPSIAELSTPDFQTMAEIFGSSMHVPVQVAGQPATLNFWSREQQAFPPEVERLLSEIAKQAGEAK